MPIPNYYVPKVNDVVRFASHRDESLYGIEHRARYRITAVGDVLANGETLVTLHPHDKEKYTSDEVKVVPVGHHMRFLQVIAPPWGWADIYTIYARDAEEASKVRGWLESGKGVKVWQNQALEQMGAQSFTAGDVEQNHWAMKVVEVVHDPERINIVDWKAARLDEAMTELDHYGAIYAIHKISGEMAGHCKALVDSYLEENAERWKKQNLQVFASGQGVIQRTKTVFESFGYIKYGDADGEQFDILTLWPKFPSKKKFREIEKTVFRLPDSDLDYYMAYYMDERGEIGFKPYDLKGMIDEHDPKPRPRRAMALGEWMEGLVDPSEET